MNYHRVNAGCAQFESAYHGGRPIVIVVGGTSKGGDYKPLKKTEILDYTVTDEWSECKSFLLKKKSVSAYKQKFAKIKIKIKMYLYCQNRIKVATKHLSSVHISI